MAMHEKTVQQSLSLIGKHKTQILLDSFAYTTCGGLL